LGSNQDRQGVEGGVASDPHSRLDFSESTQGCLGCICREQGWMFAPVGDVRLVCRGTTDSHFGKPHHHF